MSDRRAETNRRPLPVGTVVAMGGLGVGTVVGVQRTTTARKPRNLYVISVAGREVRMRRGKFGDQALRDAPHASAEG